MKDKLNTFIDLLGVKDTQHTKGMHSFVGHLYGYSEASRIREYSINKPENQKLQEYIKNEGKPKNISQVLTMLKGLHEKNDSRFFNELEKYRQEIIDKLKKNKNPASSSVAVLLEWFSKFHNNAGSNAVDKLSEELGINLFEFCEKFNKSIGFGNYLFHSTNWYEFESLLNRYEKNAPAYKIFRTVTGFTLTERKTC